MRLRGFLQSPPVRQRIVESRTTAVVSDRHAVRSIHHHSQLALAALSQSAVPKLGPQEKDWLRALAYRWPAIAAYRSFADYYYFKTEYS